MTTVVYQPSAKALRKGALHAGDRLVFLGDGSAAYWRGDMLFQSDLLYRKPDSHVEATTERLPQSLYATRYELDHIRINNITLPFTLIERN